MTARQADFETTRDLLESAGIPIIGELARNLEEALQAADRMGFPVVMKLVSPDVIHKSDAGGVILDITSREEARAAHEALLRNGRRAGATRIDGVLVQRQAKPGFELLIGARQDPVFGPVTMIGHGGRYVELFRDVSPGVGLLSGEDVLRMLSKTMAGRIIEGYRGQRLDREAVVELVIKVSHLMEAHAEVNELDLNPVIVYPKGFSIVDARLILGEPVQHPRAEDLSAQRLASLETIFDARSVCVVGASRPGSIGGIILKNSSRIEKLYPLNPKRESLLGLKCYRSFADLPETPDIAVFAVPPQATIQGFQDYCARGGTGAIIVSDGFAEIGRVDLEDQLREISEKHGVAYIGPNGLGICNNYTGLNTMFLPRHRTQLLEKPGSIGVISQSGGVALELMEMAAADNIRIGKWVSCGNASGVSIPELLAHLGDDPRIKVVAIYMEGLRNGLQFMQVGKRVSEKKPVIIIKGGMAGGAAATMSHTASLAGSFEAFQAACCQAGLFLLEELTEDPKILINILSLLTTQKPARDNRVAVVSVGGGAAILLADQLTSQNMRLARFAPETRAKLAGLLNNRIHAADQEHQAQIAERVGSNPLDLLGDCDDDRLLETIRLLDRDPETDIIVCAIYFQVPYLTEYIGERLVELKQELHKPLVISPRGFSDYVQRTRQYMTDRDVHTYTVPMITPLSIALDIWKRYDLDFTC